jgi:hypothetical protein
MYGPVSPMLRNVRGTRRSCIDKGSAGSDRPLNVAFFSSEATARIFFRQAHRRAISYHLPPKATLRLRQDRLFYGNKLKPSRTGIGWSAVEIGDEVFFDRYFFTAGVVTSFRNSSFLSRPFNEAAKACTK